MILLLQYFLLLMNHKAIRRFYTNHYNNNYLRKENRSTMSVSKSSVSQNAARPSATTKAIDDLLNRAIVTFLGDLSAREMFASENEDAIKTKMEELCADHPGVPAGGLRGKAVKLLWKAADQTLWEAKIRGLAQDTKAYALYLTIYLVIDTFFLYRNQLEFPGLMFTALENLCKRNRLGSTVIAFSYAFRDPQSDGIQSGTYDCLFLAAAF